MITRYDRQLKTRYCLEVDVDNKRRGAWATERLDVRKGCDFDETMLSETFHISTRPRHPFISSINIVCMNDMRANNSDISMR